MTKVYLCSECAKGLEADQPVVKKEIQCQSCGTYELCNSYTATKDERQKARLSLRYTSEELARGQHIFDEKAEREVAESIPDRITGRRDPIEEAEKIAELKEDEVQSEDAEIPEEVVPAKPPTDAEPEAKEEIAKVEALPDLPEEVTAEEVRVNVTMNTDEAIASLTVLEKEIAALEAKKAELEK